jgi:hypothetical protein|tara:strand:- start:395 stop:556 length:162 start_codon:yes stop_codon:yes gene_type:complete
MTTLKSLANPWFIGACIGIALRYYNCDGDWNLFFSLKLWDFTPTLPEFNLLTR